MYTRRHFDGGQRNNSYPILKSYMDWFQHTKLSNIKHARMLSILAYRLKDMHEKFGIIESHPGYGGVFAKYALGMDDLKKELHDIFTGYENSFFKDSGSDDFRRFAKRMMLCLKNFELMCGETMFLQSGNVNLKNKRDFFPDLDWFPVSLEYEVLENIDHRFPNRLVATCTYYDCNTENFIPVIINISAIDENGRVDDREFSPMDINRNLDQKLALNYNPIKSVRGFSIAQRKKGGTHT